MALTRRTLLTTLASLPLLGWIKPKEASQEHGDPAYCCLTLQQIPPMAYGFVAICDFRGRATGLKQFVFNPSAVAIGCRKRALGHRKHGKIVITFWEG